jgi:hypothetical protein
MSSTREFRGLASTNTSQQIRYRGHSDPEKRADCWIQVLWRWRLAIENRLIGVSNCPWFPKIQIRSQYELANSSCTIGHIVAELMRLRRFPSAKVSQR